MNPRIPAGGQGERLRALIARLAEPAPKLTKAELAEVTLLLPQLKDLFGGKLPEGVSALLSGLETAVPPDVNALMPKLEHVKEAKQLPGRFATDLQLVRPQLVNHPTLSSEDKAQRLFQFLAPFVERLISLGRDPAVAEQLVARAEEAGFGHVEEKGTGKDGVVVAKQLVTLETPEQVRQAVKELKLTMKNSLSPEGGEGRGEGPQKEPASGGPKRGEEKTRTEPARTEHAEPPRTEPPPTESPRPESPRPPQEAPRPQPQLSTSPQGPSPLPSPLSGERGPLEARTGTSSRRLGPQMLWNTLHLFRDDGGGDRESAAQRDTMNRLVVGMVLALGLLTLLAVLLVALR